MFADQSTDIEGTVAKEAIRLAKSLPNTKAFVHEPFDDFMKLLNEEQPKAREVGPMPQPRPPPS